MHKEVLLGGLALAAVGSTVGIPTITAVGALGAAGAFFLDKE